MVSSIEPVHAADCQREEPRTLADLSLLGLVTPELEERAGGQLRLQSILCTRAGDLTCAG